MLSVITTARGLLNPSPENQGIRTHKPHAYQLKALSGR